MGAVVQVDESSKPDDDQYMGASETKTPLNRTLVDDRGKTIPVVVP